MLYLRQIVRVFVPCCLVVAGCASLPEQPAVTAMHPAHPDAQAALLGDRASILDAMAPVAASPPDSMAMEGMDHPGHDMSMDHDMSMADDGAEASSHAGHEMNMDDGEQGPSDHSQHGMSMGDGDPEPSEEQDDGSSDHEGDHGAGHES